LSAGGKIEHCLHLALYACLSNLSENASYKILGVPELMLSSSHVWEIENPFKDQALQSGDFY